MLQTALERPQIDSHVLAEEFPITLPEVPDLSAAIQLFQNPKAAGHRQPFLNGEPSALPLIHECHVSL